MPSSATRFQLEDEAQGQRVFAILAEAHSSHESHQANLQRIYFDTFDWRVYRHGGSLWSEGGLQSKTLVWDRGDGSRVLRDRQRTPVGFAHQLSPGLIRDGLVPVVAMRRLLPVVCLSLGRRTLNILDARQKTVARVQLEAAVASTTPARRGVSTPASTTLRLEPIRGYDKHFYALLRFLGGDLDLKPIAQNEYVQAASSCGLQPGSYTSKLGFKMSGSETTHEAMTTTLKHLLDVVRDNEKGVRLDIDSEFLHDFRVAVRRTRSILGQIKNVYPPESLQQLKKDLSWLGQITGPTRDLDVYRLKLPEYQASLPVSVRKDLGPLHDHLDKRHKVEHQELVQLLDSNRYKCLLEEWQQFLDQPTPDDLISTASLPIDRVASDRIWRSYQKVLKRGVQIEPSTDAAALHRLRIDCKKLRYLLEVFRCLYDDRVGGLINGLKRLQDNLGNFNDLEVQQEALARLARSLLHEKVAPTDAVMAMGRLVERLEDQQQLERLAFHHRFEQFSRKKNRLLFRDLFAPDGEVGL